MNPHKYSRLFLSVMLGLSLTACSDDDDDHMHHHMATYQISVSNLTNAQPLTPVAVIAHTSAYSLWTLGASASEGLEMLAEGGDPSAFLSAADLDNHVNATGSSTNGPFAPGTTETVSVSTALDADMRISVASMLANTNDAFAGAVSIPVGTMMTGDSTRILAHAYDAGTEANTETAATMPGPVAAGEGFNSIRDDRDYIAVHPGVISSDDGLGSSVLTEAHRWQGPVAQITITRTQ